MDVGRRRAGAGTSVVAGSVWESRMKHDEVRGGIKVFNGEENSEESNGISAGSKLKRGQAAAGAVSASGKRKTWKSESFEKNPIQIAKGKTESPRNSEEQCKELSVSVDGLKKSPIQVRKLRSEGSKEIGVASDKAERSPVGIRKARSESLKSPGNLGKEAGESGEGVGRNSIQLRKAKSDSIKVQEQSNKDNDGSGAAIQLGKTKSEPIKDLVESEKGVEESSEEIEKNPVEIGKSGSDETCKEFGVCQDKVISNGESNVDLHNSAPKAVVDDNDDYGDDQEEEEVEEELGEEIDEVEIEIEIEKKSLDIKEINTPEHKPSNDKVIGEEKVVNEKPNKVINKEKVVSEKPNKVINKEKVVNEVNKVHFEKKETKKFHQIHQKPEPISINVKKQPPVIKRATLHTNYAKTTFRAASDEYRTFPESHNRLQSFVDLIMWKDISRSVFIFGIGTFIILSSSYTKDLNISFISVISYLGLVYLATVFLFRSIIYRGVIDIDNTSYVVGEEESIWLLKLVLPYLNEFLLKLKALFSGDPCTTMKLAALLFVLARCGNSITIWTMAKLGFFGVFTVPKVCSLYSHQITAYAKFWVRRFRDAWNSCSHKKALTVAIFLLVWNLSSIVARIWAVFMLFVAFRYYQQSIATDEWMEDDAGEEDIWHEPIGRDEQGNGPTIVDITKQKKKF
ncbi:reticulon-like protein B21 [Ziziphus jujuba]|uniref:Reticulon-like protein n=1 Tax=Ziziphus jujuba TaxID=326968 RepID=A0A6P4B2J7_ZIZJJ|nr:reticulon-like protein B21 [Ziziphus jujuba]